MTTAGDSLSIRQNVGGVTLSCPPEAAGESDQSLIWRWASLSLPAFAGLEEVDCRLRCRWPIVIPCRHLRRLPEHQVGKKDGKRREQHQQHGCCLQRERRGISLQAVA
jgi:hypothetical protein